jgi:hypothetical protein
MQSTMQSQTMPRALAASAVIAAAGLVLMLRSTGNRAPLDIAAPTLAPAQTAAPAPAAAEASDATPAETPAAARIRELEAMSETFRNTTFLIAIRDAGYVCNELLRVYGGLDESAKWLVTCSEMLAYTVGVASNGSLRTEPFLQYFDGVTPRIIDRDFDTPSQPAVPPRIEPQLLEPQPR